jgi:outer membrane protein OmpA-like peptidoglycan-associated protein
MMKYILLISLSLITVLGFSQTNLVPNPAFQTVVKKVKTEGQISLAEPWTSPTLAQGDLYISKTKNMMIGVPDNAYGAEKPMVGDNYAGILAYSYKNKEPRGYLQVKLTEKLEEGKEYCVTANVSLADLSKYACSHVGIALSGEAITANNSEVLKFDDAIVSTRLTIYETQFYWTPICGLYKAKGGEEYLTIGNFTPDENLKIKKVKRPKGFNKSQTYDAYYYVDNVSVVESDGSSNCDCDVVPGMENAKTVTTNFNSEGDAKAYGEVKIINTDGTSGNISASNSGTPSASNSVDGMIISFESGSFSIAGSGATDLDKVVEYMTVKPKTKISLEGHIDVSEADVAKLDGKRVSSVYKYLVSKGVDKGRLTRGMSGADSPADEKNKSKNMRVVITVDLPPLEDE